MRWIITHSSVFAPEAGKENIVMVSENNNSFTTPKNFSLFILIFFLFLSANCIDQHTTLLTKQTETNLTILINRKFSIKSGVKDLILKIFR